jgi:GT2 family glycosyltransferase
VKTPKAASTAQDGTAYRNSQNSLISIVIVAGPKRKAELIRCIESIRKSNYKNYEIIVVNNSQEPVLLNAIRQKFPEVKGIEMIMNTGIYGFNIGFANARGDYILGIDDDCGLRENTLSCIAKSFAEKHPRVGVISGNIFNPLTEKWCMQSWIEQKVTLLACFPDGASVFKRSVFEKVGYYDEAFFCWQHGADLSIRCLGAGFEIHFDPEIVIDHYEQRVGFRKMRAFYDMRNLVWLNLKNFSLIFFPFLLARNTLSFLALPFKQRSLLASVYGLWGILCGWLTMMKPLQKRQVQSWKAQKIFIRHFVFDKHPVMKEETT